MPVEAAAVLSRLGPFFAVQDGVGEPGWERLDDLLGGPFVTTRVAATHVALAERSETAVEPRVAASIASLGLVARLVSPTVGAVLLGTDAPQDLHARPEPVGPFPLAATSWAAPSLARLLDGPVATLCARIGRDHALSPIVLAGNVASAVQGATRMVVQVRPDLAQDARDLLAAALTLPALTGTMELESGAAARRHSCCLYYRLPGAGYCSDCILA